MISDNITVDVTGGIGGVGVSNTANGRQSFELEPSSATSSQQLAKIQSAAAIAATPLIQLKVLMRSVSIGLTDQTRRTLWLDLSMRNNRTVNADDFDTQFDNLSTQKLPNFVDPANARFYYLNPHARKKVATILWNLSQSYPQMTFAPLLYPLVSLFLHFHSPADVYRSMVALITSRESRFIGINRIDKCRDALILIKLTRKFGIAKRSKVGSIRSNASTGSITSQNSNNSSTLKGTDAAFIEWIQWIFGCLPFHFCVRIVDCYLVEGEKFLYRIALALAQLYEKHQKQSISLEQMRSFCENISSVLTPSQLIDQAVNISRFSKKDIIKARTKVEKTSESIKCLESPSLQRSDIISSKDVRFCNRIAPRKFKSSILTWNQLDILWEWIPERIYILEPLVAFCSDENGNSLRTFYALCGDNEPTIILIKTLQDQIFGAYCSSSWSKRLEGSNKSGQYFGNGETFLFSISPKTVKYDWVGKHIEDLNQLTPSQQLFMSATNHSFSVGGGGGHYGLFIDENLSKGETHRCETFDNESLTHGDPYFDVAVIEIIAFC